MTASTWNVPASYKPLSGTNIAGRVVAVGIMLFGGLVLAAGAFGVSVALDMVTRGSVVANTADLASLRAVQPVVPLIAISAWRTWWQRWGPCSAHAGRSSSPSGSPRSTRSRASS